MATSVSPPPTLAAAPTAPAAPPGTPAPARWTRPALVWILALGALARFWNLGWDGGAYGLHPDERQLDDAVRALGPDLNPHFFYYGTLPIYLYRASAAGLGVLTGLDWLAPERIALIGRTYSALAGTALILVLFWTGRRLWGVRAGLLAAGCGASAGILIQQAHYGTIDTALALAVATLLLLSLQIAAGAGRRAYFLAGLVLGLAVATKLSAASFVLLPLLGHCLRGRAPAVVSGAPRSALLRSPLWVGAGGAALALAGAAPYYAFPWLAWSELSAAIGVQTDELSGGNVLAHTWQFVGTVPYVFELQTLVVWALGLPLGLAALAGWLRGILECGLWIVDLVRRRGAGSGERGAGSGEDEPTRNTQHATRNPKSKIQNPKSKIQIALVVLWPTLYLAYIGTWEARYIRYLMPLVPFCCLFAVGGLVALTGWLGRRARWGAPAGRMLGAAVLVGAAGWGLAVLAIFLAPDTRLQSSRWFYAQVPPGSTVVLESVPGSPRTIPLLDAQHPVGLYQYRVLNLRTDDTRTKMADFADALFHGDYLEVPDRRWSAVIPRLPAYPLTARYYDLLFAGQLGYTPVATFASPPRLGPLVFADDGAEETFQVFDHPTVRLFRNTGHLPIGLLRIRLGVKG